MKFLIDAHLPKSICQSFAALGHDAKHTSELPEGNDTSDNLITALAEQENRVVITKDSDFFYSFVLHKRPSRLVLVKTGNMRLQDMRLLFDTYAPQIVNLLEHYSLIELYKENVTGVE